MLNSLKHRFSVKLAGDGVCLANVLQFMHSPYGTVPSSTSSSKLDPDPDPALLVSELQDANKNKFVNFLLITF
jgi:hypothetical protein